MMRWIITMIHLLFVLLFLTSFRLAHTIITVFYRMFPAPSLLGALRRFGLSQGSILYIIPDLVYNHSKKLRDLFSRGLGTAKPAYLSYDAMQLAAAAGYRVSARIT